MVLTELSTIVASALFGAFSTLIVQEYRAKKQQEKRISTMKRSLYAEIRENNKILEEVENPNAASGSLLSLTTYQSVSDEIGLLPPENAEAIIRYYNRANEINSLGGKIESIPSDELSGGMTHHVILDSWRRARTKAISAANHAEEQLESDGINENS